MADEKDKIDRIHNLLPSHLSSKTNTNWSGIIEAVGQADQDTADLLSEVRKQFFIKTANRPYLDRLAANNRVSRPKLVGMTDVSFREYIPVLSYKPKQVKLIIDSLLDIFFFKESTTAFITSQQAEPFQLSNNSELNYLVDEYNVETIKFLSSDFTDISAATADEVVAAFNRQAKNSYATNFYDSVTQKNYLRIFSKTVGSKGSIRVTGGYANVSLRLNGFINDAGNAANTQWTISKIGDTVYWEYTGGDAPGIQYLQQDDILISNIPSNEGSFAIKEIDIISNKIRVSNLFATVGTYTQTSSNDVKFIRPEKYTAYKLAKRAMTWETSPGEIVVEIPTTPPVVQRSLKGSMHCNGNASLILTRNSDTSATVQDASGFPKSGSFILEPLNSVTSRVGDEIITKTSGGRIISNELKYSFTSRIVATTTCSVQEGSYDIVVASTAGISIGNSIFIDGLREDAVVVDIVGSTIKSSIPVSFTLSGVSVEFGGNTLNGISPSLPNGSNIVEYVPVSIDRLNNVITVTTSVPHGYNEGDVVGLIGNSGINLFNFTGDIQNGSNNIINIPSTSSIYVGQQVSGPGIPDDTLVLSIVSANEIIMTNNATVDAAATTLSINEKINGAYEIESATSNTFSFEKYGEDGSCNDVGICSVEGTGISVVGAKVVINNSVSSDDTRIRGPYIWDVAAPYVLSSATATTITEIKAGNIVKLIDIGTNEIPKESGFVIFNYGKSNQEGPIKYLYKPIDGTLAIDPSYIFQQNHDTGSSVVALSHKGPQVLGIRAKEYPPYVTDPSQARIILKKLIESVKSAGIFVNFLIRYPDQLYGALDTYNQQEAETGAGNYLKS